MSHIFRKRWGQNFLQDINIIRKIIQATDPQKIDHFIEIGPGNGSLTFPLAEKIKYLLAVEIDPMLIHELQSQAGENTRILQGDFLKIDLTEYSREVKYIGNLPYYITTPIIFKILDSANWSLAVFMVQKEVAERICSKPGRKSYGRLSIMVQALCSVEKLFDVPPTVFYPRPEVASTVIRLTPLESEYPHRDLLSAIVKKAFGQRRKKLKNTIAEYLRGELELKYKDLRPEQLTVEDYKLLTNSCFME